MTDSQVTIIGAGISGCLTAINLTDAGIKVQLVDRHPEPMEGASRWNEGKIHLGYCYLGDPSFESAKLMLSGAACFTEEIERLTGAPLPGHWFTRPVVYLVDTETQFPAEVLWERSQKLARLLTERAYSETGLRKFVNTPPVLQRLDLEKAASMTGMKNFTMAWETSEVAIAPGPVADLIRRAVQERNIPYIQDTVISISPGDANWSVNTKSQRITSRAVVNASWESRVLLDRGVIQTDAPCSIRYKYALFCRNLNSVIAPAPSTRIIGPYGDVTPYGNGEAFLSWYPAGLAGLSDTGIPPALPPLDQERLALDTLAGLGMQPGILNQPGASWEVKGGYVIAEGHGDIDHPGSPLHSRNRVFTKELLPGYISVDTGKYSLGPLMAKRTAELVKNYLA
ncbi:MAG: FAD-binding oxidoreductase [Proteobacteria bacterium]|nr:FAD-binding oxidoreductase [Pseudomonadota bacterium]